jgi:DNA-binding transcriptional LysR family regulator
MTNIHHLELFYYVARHGGISEAVRKIPYGIQQPAISAQILQLEESLGTKLFDRRPFKLTPAGEKLFHFIEPFFSSVETVADEIRGHSRQFLRIGASGMVLRHHFPELLEAVRAKVPGLTVSLHDAIESQLLDWLTAGEIDLAITVVQSKAPAGIQCKPLIHLPLVLLVPKTSKLKSTEELWKRDKIEEPLISLVPTEAISRNFTEGLRRRDVEWQPRFTMNSIELVETYAANGFGLGVSVAIPNVPLRAGLRQIPLEGFEPITVGALWTGKASPVINTFIGVLEERAAAIKAATK